MKLFCISIIAMLMLGCSSNQGDAALVTDPIKAAQPSHTVNAFGGTIYGKNLGEFGGEIGFTPTSGPSYQLVRENSEGIFKLGDNFIVLTGLSHLGKYYGHVFVLNRTGTGRVVANKVLDLPGTPFEAKLEGATIEFLAVIPKPYSTQSSGIPEMPCYSLNSALKLQEITCPQRLQIQRR